MLPEHLFALGKDREAFKLYYYAWLFLSYPCISPCHFVFRMIGLTVGFDKKDMVDIKYRKIKTFVVTDAVVQEMYVCASVEFLMTVAHIFFDAYMTSTALETSVQTRTTREG